MRKSLFDGRQSRRRGHGKSDKNGGRIESDATERESSARERLDIK